jgi:hypothetical protein
VDGRDSDERARARLRSPRTNGFVERINRTLLDECFRVQGRTKWYTALDELKADLDTFMAFYNVGAPTRAIASPAERRPRCSTISSPSSGCSHPSDAVQEVPLAS